MSPAIEVQSFGTTTVIHTDKKKFAQLMDAVPTVAALNGGVLEIAIRPAGEA